MRCKSRAALWAERNLLSFCLAMRRWCATETLKALIAAHRAGNAAATILTAVLADPSGYGRILRKSETAVAAIVEESQLTPDQRELNEINSAIYCFTLDKLWPALAHVKPNNHHRELYLTDTIA